MSSAVMDLDQHLDCMESFPGDIQRNFTLMRELDMRGQDVMKKIDTLSAEYIASRSSLSNKKRKEMISLIEKEFLTSKSYADDKVQLATQVYEMVDKQIRLLDPKLARLESYIKEVESHGEESKGYQTQSKKGSRKKMKEKSKPVEELTKKKRSGKRLEKKMLETSSDLAEGGEALDMPVDPNEPTYCLCHQVSYGEMIGCDNPDCPIEWFHFPCVNLMAKPQGKWFCPKCLPSHKKKIK